MFSKLKMKKRSRPYSVNLKIILQKNPRSIILIILSISLTTFFTVFSIFDPSIFFSNATLLTLFFVLYTILYILSLESIKNIGKIAKYSSKIFRNSEDVVNYYEQKCKLFERKYDDYYLSHLYSNLFSEFCHVFDKKWPVTFELGPVYKGKPLFEYNINLEEFDLGFQWRENIREIVRPVQEDIFWGYYNIDNGWNQLRLRYVLSLYDNTTNSITIKVSQASFVDQMISGYCPELKVNKNITIRSLLSPYLSQYILITREFSREWEKIPKSNVNTFFEKVKLTLGKIPIANTLGMSGLVITKDGKIILPLRTSKVSVEERKIDTGISGSFDFYYLYSNFGKQKQLRIQDIVQEEILEKDELGIDPDKYKFIPICLARNITRLGSLSFCGVVIINLTLEELHAQYETTYDRDKNNLMVKEFQKLYQYDLSEVTKNEKLNWLEIPNNEVIKYLTKFYAKVKEDIKKEGLKLTKVVSNKNKSKNNKISFTANNFTTMLIAIFAALEKLDPLYN